MIDAEVSPIACRGPPGALYCVRSSTFAGVIQLVECQLPKLDVAGSSPVARSFEVL
jgi:hypothetical protein